MAQLGRGGGREEHCDWVLGWWQVKSVRWYGCVLPSVWKVGGISLHAYSEEWDPEVVRAKSEAPCHWHDRSRRHIGLDWLCGDMHGWDIPRLQQHKVGNSKDGLVISEAGRGIARVTDNWQSLKITKDKKYQNKQINQTYKDMKYPRKRVHGLWTHSARLGVLGNSILIARTLN